MKKALRNSLGAAAQAVGGTVLVVGLLAMFLAQHFWVADLLVNFQVHFVACLLGCLFLLVLLRRQLTAAVLLLGTLVLVLPIIPYLKIPFQKDSAIRPGENEKVYRMLSYNVLQSNTRTRDVADYIAAQGLDFLLVIETDEGWSEDLEFELRDHFPHRFTEPRPDLQGLTFYSKHPWKSIRLVSELSFPTIEAKFDLEQGFMTVLAIHPHPPVRKRAAERRNMYLRDLSQYAAGLSGSVILAGDFNATPWSPYFRDILSEGDLEDSGKGRGIQNTWYRFPMLAPFLGLPIDHALTRGIVMLKRQIGPPIGSDHRPLNLEFLIRNSNESKY